MTCCKRDIKSRLYCIELKLVSTTMDKSLLMRTEKSYHFFGVNQQNPASADSFAHNFIFLVDSCVKKT